MSDFNKKNADAHFRWCSTYSHIFRLLKHLVVKKFIERQSRIHKQTDTVIPIYTRKP